MGAARGAGVEEQLGSGPAEASCSVSRNAKQLQMVPRQSR